IAVRRDGHALRALRTATVTVAACERAAVLAWPALGAIVGRRLRARREHGHGAGESNRGEAGREGKTEALIGRSRGIAHGSCHSGRHCSLKGDASADGTSRVDAISIGAPALVMH